MNIMNTLMLSCVRATALMEQKEVAPLNLRQIIQLRIHVSMCSGCRNYQKQIIIVEEVLRKTFEDTSYVTTDELEAAIIKKII